MQVENVAHLSTVRCKFNQNSGVLVQTQQYKFDRRLF